MKKTTALRFLLKFTFIICLIIACGYFLLDLVLIPKVVIPKICGEVETILQQKLTITNIDISRKGTIIIDQPILYARNSTDIMLECAQIQIVPGYKRIFDSWKINGNNPKIPLHIFIKQIKLKQNPLIISGDIVSDFTLTPDFKNEDNIDWGGNIILKAININGIPTLGNIDNINGNIALSKNSLVSSNIQGKVNNEPAKLEVLINDFKNPEIILQGELFPLKFNLDCVLDGEDLSINELKASYNEIQLRASGQIIDLKNKADARITADINLELADLKNLPLDTKDILIKANPRGLIKADINVNGPLKDIPAIAGSVDVVCPKISLLNYEINNIKIASQLQNGKAALNSLEAMFLGSHLWAEADMDLTRGNLPFNARLKILDGKAARIQENFMPDIRQEISGTFNANVYAQGNVKDLDSINIQADTILSGLMFDKFVFTEPVEANIDLILKNQKDIIIKKITLADGIISLIAEGRITDISHPNGDLTVNLSTDLNKLSSYKFLNLPGTLTLSGKPALDLKVSGNLLDFQSLNLPFKLDCPTFGINQFNFDKLDIKGQFKQMKLGISTLSMKLYEGELSAKASLDLADEQKPAFNFNAYLSNVDLGAVAAGTKIIPNGFQGKLSTEMIVNGTGINPERLNADIKGTINLENAKINDIELKKVHANLDAEYIDTNIELKELIVLYKTIEVAAQGKIESVLKNPIINVSARSNLDLEDLNKLPFDFKKILDELAPKGNVNAKLQASGALTQWQQMDINANISSREMSIKKIQLKDANISANLSNRILALSAFLNSYDGTLDLKANTDFLSDNFKYKGTAKINQVNIGTLIEESKIIAQAHKGIFSLRADFSGLGTSLNTIESGIDFQLEQAHISGVELTRAIGKLLGLNFLSNFEVTQAQGTLELKNSNMHTEDTTIIGPEASIITRGDINLNQNIDIIVKLILTPQSAAQTSSQVLDKFFTFENEQYFTELDVKGTLMSPKPDISKFMRERIGSQIKKEAGKQFFKALEGLLR
ncbi:MAG: hypothetical protein L6416_00675 [Candidatus Omnitrophica bacterium]|nr:hypothetical protein [Candidatus Omnitrophota bacterium]